MTGYIDIDFRPSGDAVPSILELIGGQGYTLRALRLVPCVQEDRATLKVDIGGCRATPEIIDLARRLLELEGTIEVVHGANYIAQADNRAAT